MSKPESAKIKDQSLEVEVTVPLFKKKNAAITDTKDHLLGSPMPNFVSFLVPATFKLDFKTLLNLDKTLGIIALSLGILLKFVLYTVL